MRLVFEKALREEEKIKDIVSVLEWDYIKTEYVKCVYSGNSSSKAIARIWSTPRIFSYAFGIIPMYVIELIRKKYDKLSESEKNKVLIHELMHIPKTFSGALRSHRFHKEIDRVYNNYVSLKKKI